MATISFLGLGNMGGPMAKSLLAAGHALTVFDLVEAACTAVAAEGASIASSAAEAAEGADVIISMLPAGKHVADTFYLKPYCVSSGALGRRDYVRPELFTMLSDAGVPRGSHESCAGL